MKTLENFNAVQYMREQRRELSQKLWLMEPKEIVDYFEQKVKNISANAGASTLIV